MDFEEFHPRIAEAEVRQRQDGSVAGGNDVVHILRRAHDAVLKTAEHTIPVAMPVPPSAAHTLRRLAT